MSNRVLDWVFQESPATGNDRLVLIAIADEANDDGRNAYPGIDRIATKSRVPKRTVLRCLERLEEAGALIVNRPEVRGRGHFNTYVVLMEKGDTVTPIPEPEKVRNGATEGDKRCGTVQNHAQTVLDPLTPSAKALDPSSPSQARGARIPDDFAPDAAMRAWAQAKVPNVNLARETEKFCNYWRAKGGREARKLDWPATWRNWMLNADDSLQRTNGRAMSDREQSMSFLASVARGER